MNGNVYKKGADKQVKLKFCGLCLAEDFTAVNEAKPDYVGFVFYEKSKRNLSFDEALHLRHSLSNSIKTVGVFVDAEISFIAQLFDAGIISVAQLHGSESASYIKELRLTVPQVEIWKAFEIKTSADIQAANQSSADFVLLDGGKGQGQTFNWSFLKEIERPYGLAGGMSVENIELALANCKPALIDVSSGIEASDPDKEGKPHKSAALMQAFAQKVRAQSPNTAP